MRFSVSNQSVDPAVAPALPAMLAAIEEQLNRDFAAEWGGVYAVRLEDADASSVPCLIFDRYTDPHVGGFHDAMAGVPYVRVFWGDTKDAGGTLTKGALSLSVDLAHELLETAADWSASLWSDWGDGIEEALEVSDRVEDTSYEVDATGISVSNFLLRSAFMPGAPGPFDFLKVLTDGRGMTPGGYVINRGAATAALRRAGLEQAASGLSKVTHGEASTPFARSRRAGAVRIAKRLGPYATSV